MITSPVLFPFRLIFGLPGELIKGNPPPSPAFTAKYCMNSLAAVAQKAKIIPELLDILDYTCTNAEDLAEQEDYFAHIYAMFLLAQFREPRAYSKIFELVKKPGDIPHHLLDDVITGDLSRLLVSVCDGDTELIEQLIEDDILKMSMSG